MLKKSSILFRAAPLFLLLTCLTRLSAQKIEVSAFTGYETRSTVYTSLGYLYIGSGIDYGGTMDFNLGKNRYAEISFSHMMTDLNVDDGTNKRFISDLGVNYYSFGILKEFRPSSKIAPYGLFSIGWVNYHPQTDNISGENKFHASLAAGVKIKASERIGFKFQARLLMPVFYAGTYFAGGSGGADMSISSTSVAFQGDFTAAFVYVIK